MKTNHNKISLWKFSSIENKYKINVSLKHITKSKVKTKVMANKEIKKIVKEANEGDEEAEEVAIKEAVRWKIRSWRLNLRVKTMMIDLYSYKEPFS